MMKNILFLMCIFIVNLNAKNLPAGTNAGQKPKNLTKCHDTHPNGTEKEDKVFLVYDTKTGTEEDVDCPTVAKAECNLRGSTGICSITVSTNELYSSSLGATLEAGSDFFVEEPFIRECDEEEIGDLAGFKSQFVKIVSED